MLRLHRFYNSCQEFESWMEDKENILNTFSTAANNLGVLQAKYEVKTLHFYCVLNCVNENQELPPPLLCDVEGVERC